MGSTLSIAKREFRSYFDSPIAYVVICIGLVALGLVFFMFNGGFFDASRATMQQLFVQVPRGLSWLVIPVITMRLLAEEKQSGTLEMLITLPVRDWEVIVGKFLGAWGLVLVLIAATVAYPVMMFEWPWDLGALDTGPVMTGYLGLIVYSAAAVSIGLLISALADSQIIAFFITFVLLFFLHFIGNALSVDLPRSLSFAKEGLDAAAAFISFDSRMAGFQRGLINSRDIVYFLSITIGCLMGAFWALERRKWA